MTTIVSPTHQQLDDLMEFGHVIHVGRTADGLPFISDDRSSDNAPAYPARHPEENIVLYGDSDPGDEQLRDQIPEGWSLLTGFTGQYSYHGPVMHDSEYIGGGLAEAILEQPGFYVTSYLDWYDTDADGEPVDDPQSEGWVVSHHGPDTV